MKQKAILQPKPVDDRTSKRTSPQVTSAMPTARSAAKSKFLDDSSIDVRMTKTIRPCSSALITAREPREARLFG
jgi:hypothetical protein